MTARRQMSLIALIFLIGAGGPASRAAPPCTEPAACRATLAVAAGLGLTLYVSAPLDVPQPDIRRAIVVFHGTEGNADSYFRAMTKAVALAGKARETLVVAPRFLEHGDRDKPAPGEVFWQRGSDWRAGDLSSRDAPARVSSFDLMDRLLARLADRAVFANLQAVIVAGHSAGGQFVQRYAISQPDDPALAGLRLSYVVANPSSYLYLDGRRPVPGQPGAFAVPPPSNCQTNRFKYGFERPNEYFARQAVDDMIARYRSRPVIYLLGEADSNPNAANLSRTCAAMAQGTNRFARGTAFMAYMNAFYAPHAHRLVSVPGVAHSAARMFQSASGLKVLFAD